MAEKFIKKPVVIEAMPFDGSWESAKPILEWIVENKALDLSGPTWFDRADGALRIHTLEGTLTASAGDWIIRGIKGEFYPCKPDIFKETYEPAFTDVQDGPEDSDFCSVCEKALTPDDICATDIELGICHAACLEGSPAVDLDTGEPCETMNSFRYGQLPDDAVGEISTPRHPVVRYRIGIDRGDVFVTGGDYDGMTLVMEAADLSDAQAMLQAIAAPAPTTTSKMTGTVLAPKHTGLRVDYSGLLKNARHGLRREPGTAEMLNQLEEHLSELGRRYYDGDTVVVDEFLQLYCIQRVRREALAVTAETTAEAEDAAFAKSSKEDAASIIPHSAAESQS